MSKLSKGINMTEGSILPLLIRFTIPIMFSALLQTLYGSVDSAIVGKFAGPVYLAAVGSTSSVTNLILALFVGMSSGAGIVIAQLIGADDKEGLHKAVHTTIALSLAGGVFLTFFGVMFSKEILRLMGTPEEVLPFANLYMSIHFAGSVPTMLYNFGSGILRASGDSKNPLKFLIFTSIINVALNLIFVIAFDLHVIGVALATVICQTVSAVLVIRLLIKTDAGIKLNIRKIRFHKRMLIKIVKIGLPAGIQSSAFSFSNTVIQSTVNSFGKAAVAGCAASAQVENFVYLIMNSVSIAITTFTGQNFGAKRLDRCKKGFKISLFSVAVIGILLGVILMVGLESFIRIFTDDPEAIVYGTQRLMVIGMTYSICGIMEVLSGSMRGYGDSFSPMLICLFGVTASRMLWIFTVLPFKREIFMVYLAFPISWFITAVILLSRYVYLRKKLKREFQ